MSSSIFLSFLIITVLHATTDAYQQKCYQWTSGHDCDWYSDCLDYEKPCSQDNYAVDYGQKYCDKYDEAKSAFTDKGKAWIDAVKRCLQVKLSDVLIADSSISCRDMKKKAFESHVGCYIDPDSSSASVCSLPCSDIRKIFGVVSGAFIQEFFATIRQSFHVLGECGNYGYLTKCLWNFGK